MTISVTHAAGVVTVHLSGDVDIMTVPDLRLALQQLTEVGSRATVVVDLAGVTFLDATGLGVLVGAHRRATRAGVRFELRDPTARLRRLLAMTRLDRVLRVTSALDPVA
jgi:anti-sigma B factor antagonist